LAAWTTSKLLSLDNHQDRRVDVVIATGPTSPDSRRGVLLRLGKKLQPAPRTWSRSWQSERCCIIWMISRASIGRPSWSWCGVVRGTKGGAGSSPAESEARTRHPAVDRAEVLDGDNIRYGAALSYASRERFQTLIPFSLARRCRAGEWGFTSLRTGSLAPVPSTPCCAHLREDDGHIRRRCFRGRGIYCGIVVQDGGMSTNLFAPRTRGNATGEKKPSRSQAEAKEKRLN
jgi:hypothetical protein